MEKLAVINEVWKKNVKIMRTPEETERSQAVVFSAKYAIFSAFLFYVYVEICLGNWQKRRSSLIFKCKWVPFFFLYTISLATDRAVWIVSHCWFLKIWRPWRSLILIQIVICLNTYGWKYPMKMTVFFSIVFKDDFSLRYIFLDLF